MINFMFACYEGALSTSSVDHSELSLAHLLPVSLCGKQGCSWREQRIAHHALVQLSRRRALLGKTVMLGYM